MRLEERNSDLKKKLNSTIFYDQFQYIWLDEQNVLKLILKSPRFVPFGDNLTQFGCQIWHPWWQLRSCCNVIIPVRDDMFGHKGPGSDWSQMWEIRDFYRSDFSRIKIWDLGPWWGRLAWNGTNHRDFFRSHFSAFCFVEILGTKWVRLACNGTNPGIFSDHISNFSKSTGFVLFGANLAHFVAWCDMSVIAVDFVLRDPRDKPHEKELTPEMKELDVVPQPWHNVMKLRKRRLLQRLYMVNPCMRQAQDIWHSMFKSVDT